MAPKPGDYPEVLIRLISLLLGFATSGLAQSARPGWGSTPYHDGSGTGVTFRVWAPNATSVLVPGDFNAWSTTASPLAKETPGGVWNGVWSADLTSARPGQQYKYFLNYSGGSVWKHDPRGRMVVNSSSAPGANDIIYDPTAFDWSGDKFTAPALEDLLVYELHIGVFNNPNPGSGSPGTFLTATNRLDYLRSLGVSAVELMPIAEFPGAFSWGYNPADPYAADNNAYGGPDGLKTFVKACHARGLAVLLDVVHNHYGPTDLDLWDFDGWTGGGSGGGIYFYQDSTLCCTPYGSRPNYSRQPVRDFIQQNFNLWLDEYHVHGFRWDTPGLMMNAGGTFINDAATLVSAITSMVHSSYPGKVDIAEDVMGYGFDSTWDTVFPYVLTSVLTNTVDANRDMQTVVNAITNNQRFGSAAGFNRVAFLESHDVAGDLNNGSRLVTAIDPTTPNSYRARKLSTLGTAVTFTSPGVPMLLEGQEMLENLQFSTGRPVDWSKTSTYAPIVRFYRDLIRLRRNLDGDVAGLKGDQCSILKLDNVSKVVACRRWQNGTTGQDAVVVANFANVTRYAYVVPFPAAGTWYVHFNSDSTNYSADFGDVGSTSVTASGSGAVAAVSIGPYSVLVLSQLPFPPRLTISQTSAALTVTWPAAYGNWVLDSAAALGSGPSAWTQVPMGQYQTNAAGIFVSGPLPGAPVFYRLRLP